MTNRTESDAASAALMFTNVSQRYPASATFQGTGIANTCDTGGHDPVRLGLALLTDDERMTALTRTADAMHAKRGVTTPEGEKVDPVGMDRMRRVVDADFAVAKGMMRVPREERTRFLGLYSSFTEAADMAGRAVAERSFSRIANGLVDKHSPQPPTVTVRSDGLAVVRFGRGR